MICRYCKGQNVDKDEMCLKCRRRYNRLSGNRSKLMKAANAFEESKYLCKVLDDLNDYRVLKESGCVVPKVVEAALDYYADVQRPAIVCPCCGKSVDALHKGRSMCEDCYSMYNYLNSLYHRDKRNSMPKNRQAYRDLLNVAVSRLKAGLKVPGFAVTILKEEGLYASAMEAEPTRVKANSSIKRKESTR